MCQCYQALHVVVMERRRKGEPVWRFDNSRGNSKLQITAKRDGRTLTKAQRESSQ